MEQSQQRHENVCWKRIYINKDHRTYNYSDAIPASVSFVLSFRAESKIFMFRAASFCLSCFLEILHMPGSIQMQIWCLNMQSKADHCQCESRISITSLGSSRHRFPWTRQASFRKSPWWGSSCQAHELRWFASETKLYETSASAAASNGPVNIMSEEAAEWGCHTCS